MEKIKTLFDQYYDDWLPLCPSAGQIITKLEADGETIKNDHIALRTLQSKEFGVEAIAQPFLDLGYVFKGDYIFKEKKLRARHLEHPSDAPRVFISELEFGKLGKETQSVCQNILNNLKKNQKHSCDLGLSGRSWPFSKAVYDALYRESEYAAWFYAFGLRANHFTISFNHLNGFSSITDLNIWIKKAGFSLNDSGGEIKGNPECFLMQSSTMSDDVPIVDDKCGQIFKIPGCYLEFAQRLPDASGQFYGGFVANSADKIFESTSRSSLDQQPNRLKY